MARKFANNAYSLLAAGITNVATSLSVTAGEGARFPALGASEYFMLALYDGTNTEIVKVTARSTDSMTIVRAQEGTTARAFSTGAVVSHRLTAEALQAWEDNKQPLDATLTAISDETIGAFSHRNKIINGAMAVAQRGAYVEWDISNGLEVYGADRFRTYLAATGVTGKCGQGASAPNAAFSGETFFWSVTGKATLDTADVLVHETVLEGYLIRPLVGHTFVLGFWVKAGVAGTYHVAFRSTGGDSYVVPYTINATSTWEFKTVTVTGGLPTAGTWNYTDGKGLVISWTMAAGSTYNAAAASTWATGNDVSLAGQTNLLATTGASFSISGAQLELGTVATPFEHRPYGTELALCQRYYQHRIGYVISGYAAAASTLVAGYAPYRVAMRISPTLSRTELLSSNLTYNALVTLGDMSQFTSIYYTTNATGSYRLDGYLTASAEL